MNNKYSFNIKLNKIVASTKNGKRKVQSILTGNF